MINETNLIINTTGKMFFRSSLGFGKLFTDNFVSHSLNWYFLLYFISFVLTMVISVLTVWKLWENIGKVKLVENSKVSGGKDE